MELVLLICMAVAAVFLFVMAGVAYQDARDAVAEGKDTLAGLHYLSTSLLVSFGCLVLTLTMAYVGIARVLREDHEAPRDRTTEPQP